MSRHKTQSKRPPQTVPELDQSKQNGGGPKSITDLMGEFWQTVHTAQAKKSPKRDGYFCAKTDEGPNGIYTKYDPGLGITPRGRSHREAEMKRRGIVCIG
jgi:hypothetical protein